MESYGIGQSASRFEDPRLLKGGGRYVHDTRLPGEAWMVLVRSVHAHGNIRAIDISRAAQASGVLGIFTGEHLRRDGLGGHRE